MKVLDDYKSPNYSEVEIAVEFVVLHYTAVSFKDTIALFSDEKLGGSAHFVIDEDGAVYELVTALSAAALRANHAGESKLTLDGKEWSSFNDISIGIELVSRNGNMFNYSDDQYSSLIELTKLLKGRYLALEDPKRIIGHEHIAGHRGKVDPGRCFDWKRFFAGAYSGQSAPERNACCPEDLKAILDGLTEFVSRKDLEDAWSGAFNVLLEAAAKRLS